MLSFVLHTLALASAAAASPLAANGRRDASVARSEQSPSPQSEELLVLHPNGTTSTMKHVDWAAMLQAQGIALEAPPIDHNYLNFTPSQEVNQYDRISEIGKRQSCSWTTAVVVDRTEHFVDWEVQMSPVACATTGALDISVSSGYSVSNTVSVSGGVDISFVKSRLGSSFGVDYSRSWTTQTSVITRGPVPDGMCGVMVTLPNTTRRYGRVLQGCPGSYKQTGTFMADDRGTGSYNGVTWISGAISVCAKRQRFPPLSRCHGQGNFV